MRQRGVQREIVAPSLAGITGRGYSEGHREGLGQGSAIPRTIVYASGWAMGPARRRVEHPATPLSLARELEKSHSPSPGF